MGNKSPEEDEQTIAPVNGNNMSSMFQTSDDLLCHLCSVKLQGIVTTTDKGCTHEARTDVVNADMTEVTYMAELGKALQIMVHKTLRG